MKKRYLIIFMFLILFNVNDVYAKDYWFYADKDASGTLFPSICPNTGNGCKVECKDGRSGSDTQDYRVCGDPENLLKFKPSISFDDVEKVRKYLNAQEGCANSKTCLDYVLNNYCDNNNDDLCKDLTKHIKGGVENGLDVSEGEVCSQTFDLSYDLVEYFKFSIKITGNKLLIILNDDPSAPTTIRKFPSGGNSDEGFNGIVYGSYNMVHFYGIDSNYQNFTKKYIEEYNKTKKCPQPIACSLSDEKSKDEDLGGSYYNWYVEFAEKCDRDKYKGSYSQKLNGTGTTPESIFDEEKLTILGKTITLDCAGLFGDEGGKELALLLKTIFDIIQISVPLLLIVLGTIDFSRAAFSGSEEDMKKAQKKFIKRIIIAISVFLIRPILIALLTIANSIWGDIFSTNFCGIL